MCHGNYFGGLGYGYDGLGYGYGGLGYGYGGLGYGYGGLGYGYGCGCGSRYAYSTYRPCCYGRLSGFY
ncbi:keratin-associated protein 6-5-like isoform X1 [Grammomys surdaster]|uniref:keratin-associated protein 6-5-like isoform X1 n=1 Tax=Grammomys surdaster TaxID=491861 RepID=UPI0010A04610|nr:keratin-associated protein 6-5-like isoform X1 [Grammomys surdaster]